MLINTDLFKINVSESVDLHLSYLFVFLKVRLFGTFLHFSTNKNAEMKDWKNQQFYKIDALKNMNTLQLFQIQFVKCCSYETFQMNSY